MYLLTAMGRASRRAAKLTRSPVVGVTSLSPPLPRRPPHTLGMGVPLLLPSPRYITQKVPDKSITQKVPEKSTEGFFHQIRRCASETDKPWMDCWNELLKNKQMGVKLYLSNATEEAAMYLKQVLQRLLQALKEVVFHVSQQVLLGFKSNVSGHYYHCFVLGIVGLSWWLAQWFNLLGDNTSEGDDSDLAKLDQQIKNLMKEFPGRIALGLLYLEVTWKILKEVIMEREDLEAQMLKKFDSLNAKVEEMKAENAGVKLELEAIQIMVKEGNSQLAELSQAISELRKSSDK